VLSLAVLIVLNTACSSNKKEANQQLADTVVTETQQVELPAPYETKSVKKYSKVVGWPKDKTPAAPEGFVVTRFADGLRNPRWIYIGPNGDIFVSEANTEEKGVEIVYNEATGRDESQNLGESANRITLFRDADNDGKPEFQQVFLTGLKQPFGMLILNNMFYVANTDGILRFPYQPGQTSITAKGQKILDLPAGGYNNHWTRNIIASPKGDKIFVSVGSASNNGEHGMQEEVRRANILEINPDGTGERIFAAGLRNPTALDFFPGTNTLWVAVNERDDLGDGLVPDYLTSVKDGGFYGWPYNYFGNHDDPAVKEALPDSIKEVIVPDVALDPHSASIGFTFYEGKAFPAKYHNGAFVGQHGSWNSSTFTGYKVIFIPFDNGKPGQQEDFLTGFIKDESKKEVYGRPVGVTVTPQGALLVADDASNTIWHIGVKK
jgi:glucose/arabinose dehydrogenase